MSTNLDDESVMSSARSIRYAPACLATMAIVALSSPASANEGQFWVGPGVGNLTDFSVGLWGVGGQAGAQWKFSDFWALTGDYTLTYHFGDDSQEIPSDLVNAVGIGLRYNLDVFTYVPYIGLSAMGYLDAPQVADASLEANAGGKFVVGVDYRYSRSWSIGFSGEIHALLSDLSRYPVFTLMTVHIGYNFRM